MDKSWETHSIATMTHGRYLVEVGESGLRPPLLMGFHGYAENAERHLKALRRIPGAEGWLLCAVEALHPFYHPKEGEVIASWMTRQNREAAILDNVRYVASVIAAVRQRYETSDRLVFAGFSQGVAMAYRAAAGCGYACHGIIALAGDVPPDVAARELPQAPSVLLGRGSEDTWYDEEKMGKDLAALAKKGMEVEACNFAGGHVWADAFYEAAGAFLTRLRG